MKKDSRRFTWISVVLLALLVGCAQGGGGKGGGGDTGGTTPPPGATADNAFFQFQLTSLNQQFAGGGGAALNAATRTVEGQVLTRRQDSGEETTYNWALIVDDSAFQINTQVSLPLDPTAYDFTFMMSTGEGQYAALTPNWLILDGQNSIPFTVTPIIGDSLANAGGVFNLVQLQFQYDTDALAQFAHPAFGFVLEGGVEQIFNVNPNTGLSNTYLNLAPGEYQFEVRVYDGTMLKGIAASGTIVVPGPGGQVTLPLVSLTVVNTYSLNTQTNDASFHIVAPAPVLDSAAPPQSVAAIFSIVGTHTPYHEERLNLSRVGGNYEGTSVVPNFGQGENTWSLYLYRSIGGSWELFAHCAQSATLSADTRTLLCDLQMLSGHAIAGSEAPAILNVDVTDGATPLPGVVITANGEPVGITANGTLIGAAGNLQTFLSSNSYVIGAENLYTHQTEETNQSLQPGTQTNVDVVLVPPDTTPPVVTITRPVAGGTVNNHEPLLAFSSDEPGTASVFLDGAPIATLSGETLPWLANGVHTVVVEVQDAAHNVGMATVTFTVQVQDVVPQLDTTPPVVTITQPENGSTINDPQPLLVYSSNEAGQENVFLDGVPIATRSGETLPTISSDGAHAIVVEITDAAGNVGTGQVTFYLQTIPAPPPADTTPPVVTITQPIAGSTLNTHQPLLVYSSNEAGQESVFVDGTPVDTRSGEYLPWITSDGAHTVVVMVRDAAGNVGMSEVTFYLDVTAPGVEIQSPVDGSWINVADTDLMFLTNESGSAVITINGTSLAQLPVIGGENHVTLLNLPSGLNEVRVVVSDAVGNLSGDTIHFTVDLVPPQVTIDSPVGTTQDHEPVLGYTIVEDGQVTGVKVTLDNAVIPTQNGEKLPWQDFGEHILTVEATDAAGNVGSGEVSFTVEAVPPQGYYELTVRKFTRPTRWENDEIEFSSPARVVIPRQEAITVLAGNPNRYLLFLKLGSINCVYLGGSYTSHVEGAPTEEEFQQFHSPVCGFGRYRAGDVVDVTDEIRARVLSGDPRENETALTIRVDAVQLGVIRQEDQQSGDHEDENEDDQHDDGHDSQSSGDQSSGGQSSSSHGGHH